MSIPSAGPAQTIAQTTVPITTVQHVEAAPIIHETIRREEVEEIQPVIHREREKTEIRKITQPIQTKETKGVTTTEVTLPVEVKAEVRMPVSEPPQLAVLPGVAHEQTRTTVQKPPVVIETVKQKIVEEVTPVVYKQTVEPHVIKITQPIYEKIVEGPVYVNQAFSTVPLNQQSQQIIQEQQQSVQGLQQQQQTTIQQTSIAPQIDTIPPPPPQVQFKANIPPPPVQHVLQPMQIHEIVQPVSISSHLCNRFAAKMDRFTNRVEAFVNTPGVVVVTPPTVVPPPPPPAPLPPFAMYPPVPYVRRW
jgi:hypothetical protein